MSGLFSGVGAGLKSKGVQPPTQQAAPIRTVEEDAGTARMRERKKLQTGGRTSTILSGIQSALNKRLGE